MNSFMESLGVVIEVMEQLDGDVLEHTSRNREKLDILWKSEEAHKISELYR